MKGLSLFKTNEPSVALLRLIERQQPPRIEGKLAYLSPPWRLVVRSRSNKHQPRFNDPIFCDLAWPWKTDRMLQRQQSPREGEKTRGTSHEPAYERFEVARIRGSVCVSATRFEFRRAKLLDPPRPFQTVPTRFYSRSLSK